MRITPFVTAGARLWTVLPAPRLLIAAAALLVVGISAAAPAMAQDASTRFKAANHTQPLQGARKPLSLLNKERVNVVVVMNSPSVADARAARVDHAISEQDHAAIHAQVMQQHASIEGAITSRGGRVVSHFADAMNGIRVEIERGEVAGLSSLPGVVDVVPVMSHKMSNVVSVPYIGAPAVWQGVPNLRGEHVKIAIIDTGIDYTHANFGGPGTAAAYNTALASDTAAPDPTLFGPNAPKVKGGIDLVGDAYDGSNTPVPDPNPLDCNGHGSHVAGTAAGFGVANDGTTYQGPYNAAAYSTGFSIGPGVAPLADLYAVRVFGCSGFTNVVTEALDWAVHNGMDVVNMSLGAAYGSARNSDSLASDNAARAGIIVVAAAGNEGPAPYILGSPAAASGAIAAAATDAHATFPGATLGLNTGPTLLEQDSNGAPLPGSLPIVVLRDATGNVSLGCNDSEYVDAVIAGKLVVTRRGTCARVARAISGQNHGAAGVAMINNGGGYPPFENTIPGVTIPFIGVLKSDGAKVAAAASTTLAASTVANPTFAIAANFSSSGPRAPDSALKPDVTAPGVAVISTAMGTGNGSANFSGTSMATPHVAGVAALARQAHPNWSSAGLRAAIIGSASPSALRDYTPRIEGAGLVQAVGATQTNVVVRGDGDHPGKLSFGFAEFTRDFHDSRDIVIENHGGANASFTVTATAVGGVPHTVSLSRSNVTVGGHDETELHVSVDVPAATVGSTHDPLFNDVYAEVAGIVTLTPVGNANNGVTLTVPYYLVPRARSDVDANLSHDGSLVHLTNDGGAIAGFGDFYAWNLRNPLTGTISAAFEPRAVGVQSNPISATDSILVFAVNTHGRFLNPAAGEYDIWLDVNGDGVPDYILFVADEGGVTTGSVTGQAATFVLNLATGAIIEEALADAPTDGSTVLMYALASDLGLSPANPRFTYFVNAFDATGAEERVPGTGSFNAFTPSVSNAIFVPVAPHTSLDVPVGVDPVEFALTPALGFMVVTEDNASGRSQAKLLPLND